MKFSTKTTYALRAVIRLKKEKDLISLARIAKEEKISLSYLERIFADLKKAGLIEAETGALGGYRLKKNWPSLSVYDIIIAVEGRENMFHCFEKNKKVFCHPGCRCLADSAILKIEQAIDKTLKNLKLKDL